MPKGMSDKEVRDFRRKRRQAIEDDTSSTTTTSTTTTTTTVSPIPGEVKPVVIIEPYESTYDPFQTTPAPQPYVTEPALEAALAQATPEEIDVIYEGLLAGYEEKWGAISPYWRSIDPEGNIFYTKYDEYTVLALAQSEAMRYFSETYGSEYAGAFIQAFALTDEDEMSIALDFLTRVSGLQVDAPRGAKAAPGSMPLDKETFLSIIDNPSKFDALNWQQKNQFITAAQETTGAYHAQAEQAGRFETSTAIVATGDYTLALNEEEVGLLDGILDQTKALIGEGITGIHGLSAKAIGIHEIELSGEGPTVFIEEEWAEAHPAKAVALQTALKLQLPSAQVRVGDRGVVGSVLEVLGTPVDIASAAPGAVVRWFGQGYDELKQLDPERRRELLAKKEKIEAAIRDGSVPVDRLEEAMWAVSWASRQLDEETHVSFAQMIQEGLNPRDAGFGFANNFTLGMGLRPGDPDYDIVHNLSFLGSAILFDPLTWGPGVARGVGGVARFPKIVDDAGEVVAISRSRIANAIHSRFGLTGEEFLTSPGGIALVNRLKAARAEAGSVQEFIGRLDKVVRNVQVRRWLAGAINDEDLRLAIVAGITGHFPETVDVARAEAIANQAAGKLNKLDDLDNNVIPPLREEASRLQSEYAHGQLTVEETLGEGRYRIQGWQGRTDAQYGTTHFGTKKQATDRVANLFADPQIRPSQVDPKLGESDILQVEWSGKLLGTPERPLSDVQANLLELTYGQGIGTPKHELAAFLSEDELLRLPSEVNAADLRELGYDGILYRNIAEGYEVGKPNLSVVTLHGADSVEVIGRPTDAAFDLLQAERDAERLRLTRADDTVRAAFYRDVAAGRGLEQGAAMVFPRSKELKSLVAVTPYEKAMRATSRFVENFPRPLLKQLGLTPERLRKADEGATEWLVAVKNIYKKTGLEGAEAAPGRFRRFYFFHDAPLPGGALIDAGERTRGTVRHMLEFSGTDSSKIDALLGEFDLAMGDTAQYKWLTERFWPTMLDSPALPTSAKQAMGKLWDTTALERGVDQMVVSKSGEVVRTEPVLYSLESSPIDPSQVEQVGFPVFEGDLLQGSFQLPSLQEFRDYMSFNQRLLNHLGEKARVGGKASALLYNSGVHILTAVTSLWKTAVLMGRLGALPARIVSEAMLRLWGLDTASLVNSPMEWLRAVRSADEFAAFAESPKYALGALTDEAHQAPILAGRRGRNTLEIVKDDYWEAAYSGRMGSLHASPSVRYLLESDPQTLVNYAKTAESAEATYLRKMLAHWTSGAQDEVEAVTRIRRYLDDLIGDGPDALLVREAILSGKIKVGDDVLAVGTREFGDWLKEAQAAGRWRSRVDRVRAGYTEALVTDPAATIFGRSRDWFFRWVYAKPEIFLARAPLYRQLGVRFYKKYKAIGYGETAAYKTAQAEAARRTSDYMFKIGAHTSGEFAMRNLSPFFPAWRELAATWISRVPQSLGGGNRLLGGVFLLRRADIFAEVMKDVGVIQVNEEGQYIIPVPFLGSIMQAITGNEDFEVEIPVSSLFGLLPFPDPSPGVELKEKLSRLLPGLGPLPATVLGSLSRYTEALDDFADVALPYGKDVTWGPGAADRVYSAFATLFGSKDTVPPWEKFASFEYRQALDYSAISDSVRIVVTSGRFGQPPDTTDYATDTPAGKTAYVKDFTAWKEDVLRAAYRMSAGIKFFRAIAGAIMPFSLQPVDPYRREMDATWEFLNSVPEDVQEELTGPFLDTFSRLYPEAEWYKQGKFIDLRRTVGIPDERTLSDFYDDYVSGLYTVRTPEEYVVWAYGMSSYAVYQTQRDHVYQAFGKDPATWLVSGAQKSAALVDADERWEDFLLFTDAAAEAEPEGPRSFRSMFEQWQAAYERRASEGVYRPTTSIEQDRLLDLKRNLAIVQDVLEHGTYVDVRREIAAAIGDLPFSSSNTVGKVVDSWYKKVADPYYQQLNSIHQERLLVESELQAPYYNAARILADSQKSRKMGGYALPTPEQVAYYNMTPQQQKEWAVRRASLPGWWLTRFQRSLLGYDTSKKADQFVDYVNEREMKFDEETLGIHSSSTEYEQLRERADREIYEKAAQLGVESLWQDFNKPLYEGIDSVIDYENPTWDTTVKLADAARDKLEGRGLSIRSTTDEASAIHRQFSEQVNQLRAKDSQLDSIFNELGRALGEEGQPLVGADLYLKVFFDWGPYPIPTAAIPTRG